MKWERDHCGGAWMQNGPAFMRVTRDSSGVFIWYVETATVDARSMSPLVTLTGAKIAAERVALMLTTRAIRAPRGQG